MPVSEVINWKRVPKQALVDALRNASLGPTRLSAQDKPDLVEIALAGLRSNRHDVLLKALETEVVFQVSAERWAEVLGTQK